MHGRSKRAASHHALALVALGCLGSSFVAFPALAQGAGGKSVSVTVNPTTGYTVINSQTIGTPRGTTVGPSGGVPTVTPRPGGGLSQSLPAGIEITGIRQNSQTLRGPLGATLNATAGALKNGAVRCMTSFRCTNAIGLATIGLQTLLDNVNWELADDGRPVEVTENPSLAESTGGGWFAMAATGVLFESPQGACDYAVSVNESRNKSEARYNQQVGSWICYDEITGAGWTQVRHSGGPPSCAGTLVDNICMGEPTRIPVPPSVIADTVDNHYTPDPSDWNWLTGGLDLSHPGVTVEVTDLPVLDGSNEPNFITAADGTSRGTFNTYTPSVTGNDTSKPEIEVRDEQTETTYDEQGNPTGSSTSTGTMTPNPGGSASSPDIVIPTDCDFMPTVCRFIDWFTEPDTQPDPDQEIRDLVQVYEDGGRDVSVGSESGSCPPPRTIQLSLVPPVEFSFQPFCDLATAVRFWLLAIASFGAAYMTVRSI